MNSLLRAFIHRGDWANLQIRMLYFCAKKNSGKRCKAARQQGTQNILRFGNIRQITSKGKDASAHYAPR